MEQSTPTFTPILLGSDFNAYGMARSLYELYGQPVKAYAEVALAPTRYTNIVDLTLIDGFTEDPTWIDEMLKLKENYRNANGPVILIACGDGYAELIAKHKDELEDVFVCPYIDYDLIKQLNDKAAFYQMCEKYDMPYPGTRIITEQMYNANDTIEQPFDYPVALKPADSVAWLDVHFDGRKKAFTIHDRTEFDSIIAKSYDNGYTGELVLQDFIPGDDSNMRTLNAYVGKDHKVKMMCLGHPLLEDPAPAAIGNYVAILPEYNQTLYNQIQHFLESINYTGYANFDMKYDQRDSQFKLFDMNIRQGRSSFFVTLNGNKLADWVVQDYVFDSLTMAEPLYANKDQNDYFLWLGVSPKTFEKYARDSAEKDHAVALIKNGRWGTTFWYAKDRNLKRYALYKWAMHNYQVDFKKNFVVK